MSTLDVVSAISGVPQLEFGAPNSHKGHFHTPSGGIKGTNNVQGPRGGLARLRGREGHVKTQSRRIIIGEILPYHPLVFLLPWSVDIHDHKFGSQNGWTPPTVTGD